MNLNIKRISTVTLANSATPFNAIPTILAGLALRGGDTVDPNTSLSAIGSPTVTVLTPVLPTPGAAANLYGAGDGFRLVTGPTVVNSGFALPDVRVNSQLSALNHSLISQSDLSASVQYLGFDPTMQFKVPAVTPPRPSVPYGTSNYLSDQFLSTPRLAQHFNSLEFATDVSFRQRLTPLTPVAPHAFDSARLVPNTFELVSHAVFDVNLAASLGVFLPAAGTGTTPSKVHLNLIFNEIEFTSVPLNVAGTDYVAPRLMKRTPKLVDIPLYANVSFSPVEVTLQHVCLDGAAIGTLITERITISNSPLIAF